MSAVDFRGYQLPVPTYADLAAEYEQILNSLDAATSGEEAIRAVEQWDALRRRFSTWNALAYTRFCQDTQNEQFKRLREYRDELEPKMTDLAVAMKERLVASPHRAALEARFGTQAFALWECDIASFDPAIETDLVEQSKLGATYAALLAGAKFQFHGEELTLSEIKKFEEDPDRDVRHEAARLRWEWFGRNQEQLDEIFDRLVRLRQTMAEKTGFAQFIDFGYQLRRRIDYGRGDVERFRDEVRERVVPLVGEIRAQQAARLGVEPLMAWDEALFDPAGNPRPLGDAEWMVERASEMFAELGGGMDECFAKMRAQHLMDLCAREGKQPGGFCEMLPDLGMPLIFANFNGTMSDVGVFTHEMGHAFQVYSSRAQPLEDYLWPTIEACEILSMGLEFLTWPQMELFFGEGAERFRRMHLAELLTVLPYIVAVDHFQHLVYAEPHCTADDRAAMWQEMERLYLPTLRWGDLAHPASGRRWHAQLHIFDSPFYYIDYGLALTCALQFWKLAATDCGEALARFGQLCRRGGEAPFGELVKSAGLMSPFEAGCLERVVGQARAELNRAV